MGTECFVIAAGVKLTTRATRYNLVNSLSWLRHQARVDWSGLGHLVAACQLSEHFIDPLRGIALDDIPLLLGLALLMLKLVNISFFVWPVCFHV